MRASRHWLKIGLFVLLILSLITTACDSNSGSPTASNGGVAPLIRIYASLPQQGSSKSQSQSLINAMQLALKDTTNGTNLVGGFKIDFVPLDDSLASTGRYSTDLEAANANKAASDPDAMFYLGPINTDTAETAIPILNRAGMVMISPGTTYPGLTKSVAGITRADEPARYYPSGVRNYFRLLPTDELQGRADASFTDARLQSRTVYLVDDGTDYGVGLAKSYEQAVGDYSLKIVGHDTLPAGKSDATATIGNIKTANPDTIFYAGASGAAGGLLNGVRAAGIKAHFLGGGGIQDASFLQQTGDAGNGAYSSISGTDSSGLTSKGVTFIQEYKAKYGDTLEATTIYGYDAMNVALNAIKVAGKKDRSAILGAVAATKKFDGAGGTWSFDVNGESDLSIFSFYVDRGHKWIFSSVVDTSPSRSRSAMPAIPNTTPASLSAPTPIATPRYSPRPLPNRPPPSAAANGNAPGPTVVAPDSPAPANVNHRVDAATQLPAPFQLYKLADLPVAVYLPPPTAQPPQVMLVLHGMFNNGGSFGLGLIPFAKKHNLVLIAPTFDYNVNYKNPDVVASEDVSLSNQLNLMVGQLSQVAHFDPNAKLLVFGFSRGAQLAHHYSMFYPAHVLAISVLSAGAYTLPLARLNDQPLPFPYGVSNMSEYTNHDFDQVDFVSIPFDVQVGAEDNDPEQVSRIYDVYIGPNRGNTGANLLSGFESRRRKSAV